MNYVTTNIRLSEEDYLRLKAEAASKRKSLSAIIRERISSHAGSFRSTEEIKKIMDDFKKHGRENAKFMKNTNGVQIIRELRDDAKW